VLTKKRMVLSIAKQYLHIYHFRLATSCGREMVRAYLQSPYYSVAPPFFRVIYSEVNHILEILCKFMVLIHWIQTEVLIHWRF